MDFLEKLVFCALNKRYRRFLLLQSAYCHVESIFKESAVLKYSEIKFIFQ